MRNFFLFCYNKAIYVLSECIINNSTSSKKYLFLKPASGSENNHEFIACIGIGILMRYRDSYWNCYTVLKKFGIVPSLHFRRFRQFGHFIKLVNFPTFATIPMSLNYYDSIQTSSKFGKNYVHPKTNSKENTKGIEFVKKLEAAIEIQY